MCRTQIANIQNFFSVREEQDAAAFDEQSSSLIRLNNGTVLYLREVNKFLALVCILREDNFEHKGKPLHPNLATHFLHLFYRYNRLQFPLFSRGNTTSVRAPKQGANVHFKHGGQPDNERQKHHRRRTSKSDFDRRTKLKCAILL